MTVSDITYIIKITTEIIISNIKNKDEKDLISD